MTDWTKYISTEDEIKPIECEGVNDYYAVTYTDGKTLFGYRIHRNSPSTGYVINYGRPHMWDSDGRSYSEGCYNLIPPPSEKILYYVWGHTNSRLSSPVIFHFPLDARNFNNLHGGKITAVRCRSDGTCEAVDVDDE